MAVKRVDIVLEFQTEYQRVKPWLLKALEYQLGDHDERKLLSGLGSQRYQLWVSDRAACVTELCVIDNTDVCLIYLVAGETNNALGEILGEGQAMVEEFAKANGCKGFYGIGRPEWKRVLSPHGFEVVSVNYFKEF
jgi:hypothetical protein